MSDPAGSTSLKRAGGRAFPSRKVAVIAVICALLPLAVILAVSVGSVSIPFNRAARLVWDVLIRQEFKFGLNTRDSACIIIQDIRLPRVLAAAMVGAALAGSGTVYQALFRNPMAEPYVMGVSAGAALGATIGFMFQIPIAIRTGLPAVPLLAFAGALGTTLLVYGLARRGRRRGVEALLLAGITISAFLSAVISLLMLVNRQNIGAVMLWVMGGFAGRGWSDVDMAWPYILLGLFIIVWHANELNLMLLGEDKAQQLGLNPRRVEFLLVLGATMASAAAVAVSGLIGFVGLIVPHVVRLLIGPDHRLLLPGAIALGASFVVLADVAARSLLAPVEIPVGVVTALMGGPFFLYLLSRTKES